MQDFRKLAVWRKSLDLAREIYRLTATFPNNEKFGLTSQMRRAAVSIASNLAEGCGRGTPADMRRFLLIAMGSASELHCQLLLAHELDFLTPEALAAAEPPLEEVKRMLATLILRIAPREL
ncbi:MAG: four helix bundle protein [Terriglobales bacterium]